MPKTRQQKENTVAQLSDKLSQAKSVVFTNYQGLTMSQLSDLRKQIRSQGGEYTITKNNLLKLVFKNNNTEISDTSALEGPTALLISFEDEVLPIKTLAKAFKELQIGEVKGGLLSNKFLAAAKVNQLATLPSQDELRAKVVGALGGPLYGIVGVLQANLRNLVYALDQVRRQKGGE
jgi:large subunit ribosomal protein L10